MTEVPGAAGSASVLLDRLGGRRGLVEGAIPVALFSVTYSVAGLVVEEARAVVLAVVAAVVGAVAVLVSGVVQGAPLAGGLRGAALLGVGVGFVLWTGSARDFFLPGIYVDAAYAVLLALSVLVGRPIVGYVSALLFGVDRRWRMRRDLRRTFSIATLVWSAAYAVRASAQTLFYRADQTELLAVAKVVLGWPLTALAVVATIALARRSHRTRAELS